MTWRVHGESTPPGQPGAIFSGVDDYDQGDEPRIPTRATGATAAPAPTDHSAEYPGGGASKNTRGDRKPGFPTILSAKPHENQAIDPEHGGNALDFDSCIAVGVRDVSGLPPPTQENPENDKLHACAAETTQRPAAARTRRRMPSLSSSLAGVLSRASCDVLRYS